MFFSRILPIVYYFRKLVGNCKRLYSNKKKTIINTVQNPIFKELIRIEEKNDSKTSSAVEKSTSLATSILADNYVG